MFSPSRAGVWGYFALGFLAPVVLTLAVAAFWVAAHTVTLTGPVVVAG